MMGGYPAMETPMLFKFSHEDPDSCRVYYKADNRRNPDQPFLFCLQNNAGQNKDQLPLDQFAFYACTQNGEPSYQTYMPEKQKFDRLVYPSSNKR